MVNKRQILYTLESWCKEKTKLCMSFINILGALNYPVVFWLDDGTNLERQVVQKHRSTQIKSFCYFAISRCSWGPITRLQWSTCPSISSHLRWTSQGLPSWAHTAQTLSALLSFSDSHYPSHGHTGRTGNPWHLCLEELHVKVIAPNTQAADN